MLQLSIILLVIGVLAILLELLMPGFDGFISGVIGILALVASAILAVLFVPWGLFLVAVNLTVLVLGFYFLYKVFKGSQSGSKIILSENLAVDLPPLDLGSLVGKEGKTITLLRPYGEVDFDGIRVEVTSRDGQMINRGERVKVIETQANKVVVSLINGN